jgi:hypothetical protein
MADSTRSESRGGSGASLVPDFEKLPVTALRNRIRSLTREELGRLLAHEHEHAQRPPVLELIQIRIEQLARGAKGGVARRGGTPGGGQNPRP